MATNLSRHDFVILRHRQYAWERAGGERLDPHLAMMTESRVFERLCLADPTGGRYWRWLSDWRRRGWEAAGLRAGVPLAMQHELFRALSLFHDVLPCLKPEARDVGRYKHPAELIEAASCSDPSIFRRDRQRERDQTAQLFHGQGWTLIRLDGPDAARRWAWGTRWCTCDAAAYSRYRLKGELLMFLTPQGKFQLATGSGELRDAADHEVQLVQVITGAPQALVAALAEVVPSCHPAKVAHAAL